MKKTLSCLRPLMTLFLLLDATIATAGPHLKVEPKHVDFGVVLQGESIKQTLHVYNDGDEQLKIEQVKTSCGCTAALPSKNMLSPGETGEVETTFNSTGFSGKIKKIVYIYSNDKSIPVTEVTLEGRVIPEIEVTPELIELPPLKPGVLKVVPLTIINHGKTTVTITGVQVLVQGVEVQLSPKAIPPGESFHVSIQVNATAGTERLSGYLIIQTDRPNRSAIRVPFYAPVEDN